MGRAFVLIRRDHMVEDGFARLGNLSDELKARIQIQFIDEHGLEEAGIDGGGLFKDFMENLVKQAFDPSEGLFNATSDNRLYPNPAAQLGNIDAMPMMEFLGSMLGKCMYEVRYLAAELWRLAHIFLPGPAPPVALRASRFRHQLQQQCNHC